MALKDLGEDGYQKVRTRAQHHRLTSECRASPMTPPILCQTLTSLFAAAVGNGKRGTARPEEGPTCSGNCFS